MSAAEDLLSRLQGMGLVLKASEDRLFVGPKAAITEAARSLVRQHKPELLALLKASIVGETASARRDGWSAAEWRRFFAERVARMERAGGHAEAAERAAEWCVVEWLNRTPAPSDPGRCAWCGAQERTDQVVLPFGTESSGHAWLHPGCWRPWHADRRARAQRALAAMGLAMPRAEPGSDTEGEGTTS